METKGLIHVSAPDHPEAGRRNLPLERGPVAMRGVRDPMRGPGPCGGPGSSRGPEPRLLVLECLSLHGTRGVPAPSPAVEPVWSIVGRTRLRTAGVRLFGCSQG